MGETRALSFCAQTTGQVYVSPQKEVHPGLFLKAEIPSESNLFQRRCQLARYQNIGRCVLSKHNERFVKQFLREVFEPGPQVCTRLTCLLCVQGICQLPWNSTVLCLWFPLKSDLAGLDLA